MRVVDTFNFIKEIQELDFQQHNKIELNLLIDSESDYYKFLEILETAPSETLAVSRFRLAKLEKNWLPLDDFLTVYMQNPLKALTLLFKHHVSDHDVHLLQSNLLEGKTTLIDLYYKFNSNKRHHLLRFIK